MELVFVQLLEKRDTCSHACQTLKSQAAFISPCNSRKWCRLDTQSEESPARTWLQALESRPNGSERPWMDMNISSLEVEKMRNWKQAPSSCSCLECKERLWEWHAEVTDDYDVFQEAGVKWSKVDGSCIRQAVSTDHWTLTLARAGHLDKGSVRVTKQRSAGAGLRKIISGKCHAFLNNFPHSSMKSLSKCNNASNMNTNTSSVYIVPAVLLLVMPNYSLTKTF